MPAKYPQRIVCLTDEAAETLFRLGAGDRVVGVSALSRRPPEVRLKPRVSLFTSARSDDILALRPDLVIGFSDLQAEIAAELIRRHLPVLVLNQRTVEEILAAILLTASLVGLPERGRQLVAELESNLEHAKQEAARGGPRPRVYFEEWDDPPITGIAWVSELIEIAGGVDCFAELACQPAAKERILANPVEVVRRQPDLIIGSWCGKKFRAEQVCQRPGWSNIPAVRDNQLYEIDSSLILQPGPAALDDGLRELRMIIDSWRDDASTRHGRQSQVGENTHPSL